MADPTNAQDFAAPRLVLVCVDDASRQNVTLSNIVRALSIACGSYARTSAPCFCTPWISVIVGESRMSSVSGLKARPRTAIVLPRSSPSSASATLTTIRSLIS